MWNARRTCYRIRASTKGQTRREAGAQSLRTFSCAGGSRAAERSLPLSDLVRWPDSEVKKGEVLLRSTVDELLRCPKERKEAATREALAKLRPHLEVALEALEAVGRTRGLDDEAMAKRKAFRTLLGLAGQPSDRSVS